MAHKPKYAKQEPRRNTALKLLPLVLAVSAGRIWGFEVSGNDTVATPEILQALERCGVAGGGRSGWSAEAQARVHRLHHRGWRLRF